MIHKCGRASSVIVSPTKVTKNHMVDPSLFRVVLLPLQKIISEFGKNQKVAIFQQVLNDQHSYQRFFPKLHNF
jgi:hypothetical protein